MAAMPFEHAEEARQALRAIVAEHGPDVLSSPSALSNLLSDLLPDAPRVARILVAAAQDQIAEELREHTSVGMDALTASRLAASSFAGTTMFAPEACTWVVEEFALALGLTTEAGAIVPDAEPVAAPSLTAHFVGPDRSTEPTPTALVSVDSQPGSGGQPALGGVVGQTALDPQPHAGADPDRLASADNSAPGGSASAGVDLGAAGGTAPGSGAATGSAVMTTRTWAVVVTADRAYFDATIAERDPGEEPIEFPADYPEFAFELSGAQMRIGRRSVSRGLKPEIDLAGPPTDPGISHLHAVLIAQQDGTWAVLDTGSSNGTQVNGRELVSGQPAPLRGGDSICLGAWTKLTIRSA
jgi:FHA domain